jgi:hypothetical protein
MDPFWLDPGYKWLDPADIRDCIDAVIKRDGTAACPYSGRAHLYTGPRASIFEDNNILGFDILVDGNYPRARFLAPIYNALLIDDMNISKDVTSNVDGTGMNVYDYLYLAHPTLPRRVPAGWADNIMRHSSLHFVDSLYGEVTTSVIGAGRDRVFFDTEFPRLSQETNDLVTGLAKSRDIKRVNDGPIGEIRNLWKQNAIELAYRVICVNEQDKLRRTAWTLASEELMQHSLAVEEFYMIDRQQMWKEAAKEIFDGRADPSDLIKLDAKLNARDRKMKRSPEYCGTPAERFTQKEQRLFLFVLRTAHRRGSTGPI